MLPDEVAHCSLEHEFTISGKTSSLIEIGLLLNELEKSYLGYLCSICVAGSDAQGRQSLKNDRGRKCPKEDKYQE